MMTADLQQAYNLLRAESAIWAMAPEHIQALATKIASTPRADDEFWYANPPKRNLSADRPRQTAPLSTAIIPVVGPLMRRGSALSEMFGFTSYSKIRSSLAQAAGDPSVDQVVLYVDSPGGAALGVEELANDIVGVNRKKPVVAYVDGMAASAGYWIASAAGTVIGTPSSEHGSIGVYAVHQDISQAMQSAGIVTTFVVSKVSPQKVKGNSYEPIDKETMARMQADADAIASKFVKAVARGRRISEAKVKSDFGQGGLFFSEKARAAGMIDRISSDFNDALRSPSMSGRSAAQARRDMLAAFSSDDATRMRKRRLEMLRHG